MLSKYKTLSSPEIFFHDCFKKNKTVCCQETVFLQNHIDITDDVYTHVFPTLTKMVDESDSFFGVGLIIKDEPRHIVQDVRTRLSKGVKSIPDDRFILPNMDVSVIRIIRYAQFNVAFESIVISYVYDGEYTITIEGETHTLIKGNAIIISPNILYSAIIDNYDTVVFNLNIRVSSLTTAFLSLITENNYISKFILSMLYNAQHPPYTIFQSGPDERLSDILLQLFDLQESSNILTTMNNTLAQLFICRLFYYYEDFIQNKNSFSKSDILVADIISYLHKNYTTTSLKDVSERFSLSAKYLSRILKEKAGMNYISLIQDIKLEKAKELLKNTDINIDEVCSIIGYNDSRQLRLIFRQRYGMSPSEYRIKKG